jgi:hypothetical protein
MKLSIRRSRARTFAGLVLLAGLGPFLLALMACLKVPVGDPEKSRIDPALSGVWRVEQNGKSSESLWIIEPWDARTWIVTTLDAKDDDSADEPTDEAATTPRDVLALLESNGLESIDAYKAWLATFGGVRFLVLEPKRPLHDLAGEKPEFWFAFKVHKATAERVELLLAIGKNVDEAKTTAKAEAILRKHARDPALYGDGSESSVLLRVPETEYGRVDELLESLNISTE